LLVIFKAALSTGFRLQNSKPKSSPSDTTLLPDEGKRTIQPSALFLLQLLTQVVTFNLQRFPVFLDQYERLVQYLLLSPANQDLVSQSVIIQLTSLLKEALVQVGLFYVKVYFLMNFFLTERNSIFVTHTQITVVGIK
jgi:hypothetical protein